MCGLFGHAVTHGADPARSKSALETLAHRGPDLRHHWADDRIFIGHARLSILDLSERGRQPMLDRGATCAIAVNGEIYNYKALRAELSRKHHFASESDSEVVLHGYKEWGLDGLLRRLEGMYALCIYDRANGKILLARDRVGIKPLYHALVDGQFAWASELKAIEAYFDRANLAIDRTALYDFLTYRYVPAPKSLYRDVQKLPPAHALSYDLANGQVRSWRYWSLPVTERQIEVTAAADRLRELLSQAVTDQMVSDVPVGFFLSGGIDSSAVVASAASSRNEVCTFSIEFEGEQDSEATYAAMVADRYKTRHETRVLTSDAADTLIRRMRAWYDEPFADSSAMPTFLLSRFAREQSTVVLTGDGGDEVFGGYTWYDAIPRREARTPPVPRLLRALVSCSKRRFRKSLIGKAAEEIERRYLLTGLPLHLKLINGMIEDEKADYRRLWEIPDDYDDYWHLRRYDRPDLPPRTRLQYIDFHTFLPDDVLTKVDRASMAVSLEVRVPLLATDIVEFAFSLPEEVRYHSNRLKGLLRTAMAQSLPREVIERPKRGFGIPRRPLSKALFADLLTRQEYVLREFFPDCLSDRA